VAQNRDRWSVTRGATTPLYFDSLDAAKRAAENLPRVAAANGDRGGVKILGANTAPQIMTFSPEWLGQTSRRPPIGCLSE